MGQKKKYTQRQINKFLKAANMLTELGEEGARFYLAAGTLNLMAGPAHDDSNFAALQNNVVESVNMRGCMDGGDW